MPEAGRKSDKDKLRYDLVPTLALKETVKVLTKGAVKYGEWNWHKGLNYSRLYASAQRHLNSFWQGEDVDIEDTKLGLPSSHHLANALCCIMFLLEFELENRKEELDNRQSRKVKASVCETETLFTQAKPDKNSIEKQINELKSLSSVVPKKHLAEAQKYLAVAERVRFNEAHKHNIKQEY